MVPRRATEAGLPQCTAHWPEKAGATDRGRERRAPRGKLMAMFDCTGGLSAKPRKLHPRPPIRSGSRRARHE